MAGPLGVAALGGRIHQGARYADLAFAAHVGHLQPSVAPLVGQTSGPARVPVEAVLEQGLTDAAVHASGAFLPGEVEARLVRGPGIGVEGDVT